MASYKQKDVKDPQAELPNDNNFRYKGVNNFYRLNVCFFTCSVYIVSDEVIQVDRYQDDHGS